MQQTRKVYNAIGHAMDADAQLQYAEGIFTDYALRWGNVPEPFRQASAHVKVARAHYRNLISTLDDRATSVITKDLRKILQFTR